MSDFKFCTSCGTKLTNDSSFCNKCGTKQKYIEDDVKNNVEVVNKENILENTTKVITEENIKAKTKKEIIFPLNMRNNQQGNLNICYLLSLIGLFIFSIPKIFEIESMDTNGFLTFIGITIFITSFVVGKIIFKPRAKVLQSIIEGKDIIVVWQYTKTEWKKHVGENYEITKDTNKGMLIFLCIISTVIFLPFIIATEGNMFMIIVLIVLLSTCGLAALISVSAAKKVFPNPYVIIAQDGLLLNDKLYSWKGIGLKLLAAGYTTDAPNTLSINFRVIYTRHANQSAAVLIPKGQENSAREVINMLNSQIEKG